MNHKPLVLLLLLALLFFWAVGAHSRLSRLRQGLAQAAARLAQALGQRSAAHAGLQAVLQRPLAAEHGALMALDEAHAASQTAAKAWAARPMDLPAASAWVASERPMVSCAARVLALLDQRPDLTQQPEVAQPLQAWQQAQARLALLRQNFNDMADRHDRALAQFPTRWLARLFRFAAAGRV